MEYSEFKDSLGVGDTVTIKDWDTLLAEFGDGSKNVNIEFGFTSEMKRYCGNIYKIKKVFFIQGDQKGFNLEADDPREWAWSAQTFEIPFEHSVADWESMIYKGIDQTS